MTNTNIHSDPPQQNIDSSIRTSATQSQQPTAQPTQVQQTAQPTDRDSLINTAADGVIDTLNISMRDLIDPTSNMPEQIRGSILNALRVAFELENQARPKGSKLSAPEYLPGYVVARVILATGDIKVMLTGQDSHKMICKHYYNDQHGVYRWAGTYDIINAHDSAGPVMMAFQRLCPNGTRQDLSTFDREIRRAPRVRIQSDDKLVWFRNGLWDYRNETAQQAASAIDQGVSGVQKGLITKKLKEAHAAVSNSTINGDSEQYYQDIAFAELDMLIGKLKGTTKYKALNTIDSLTNTEKKILERVINIVEALDIDNSDAVIEAILNNFSAQ